MTDPARKPVRRHLSEVDLNVLAQRFYEASRVQLPSMTDKPLIVEGLRAVFESIGMPVDKRLEGRSLTRDWSEEGGDDDVENHEGASRAG